MGPTGAGATRAGLLALAAAVLGLAAHGEAGGVTTPSPTTLVVGLGVVLATAALSRVPPRPLRTAAVLAAGQLAMHLAQGHGPADTAHAMPGMTPDAPGGGLGMIGAHLAVAALVAAGVVQADRGLVGAARTVAARIVTALTRCAPAPVAPTSSGVADAPPAAPPTTARPTRLPPRRGPPSGPATPTPIPHGRNPSCPIPGRRAPSPA